jgi:CheY-like chemotaxis protein
VALDVSAPGRAVWVNGDPTRLSQVVGNLLGNAAKYTNGGGRANLTVLSDTGRSEAVVRLEDTGRGIAPQLLPHLFEPFIQADVPLDRNKGRLGLGLALVKGLVEMHGGTACAASEGVGRGATFTLRLPLDRKEAPVAEHEVTVGPVRRRRVLLIEDNVDAAESLSELLAFDGHEVAVALTGRAGIEKARAYRPDIVLCDIGLPELDGYEVARTFRADPELSRVRLVALTGYAGPGDEARARAAGFSGHISKPPSLAAIERELRNS